MKKRFDESKLFNTILGLIWIGVCEYFNFGTEAMGLGCGLIGIRSWKQGDVDAKRAGLSE